MNLKAKLLLISLENFNHCKFKDLRDNKTIESHLTF